MNEKIINYIQKALNNEMRFCLKTRRDYSPNDEMFHFYTGAISYLKEMYVTIVEAKLLAESEDK